MSHYTTDIMLQEKDTKKEIHINFIAAIKAENELAAIQSLLNRLDGFRIVSIYIDSVE